MAQRTGLAQTFHIFMSHLHWDHIMGLPFFTPAFVPGNRVVIYGSHHGVEAALRRQQDSPSFPVDFSIFGAKMEFAHLEPGLRCEVAGVEVTSMLQLHGGDSYGWRFESQGKTLVYATDSEHPLTQPQHTQRCVDFFREADLVIFDGMYSLADAVSVKADWGHSSNLVGVELCQAAGVRQLCLFHHEPAMDDASHRRGARGDPALRGNHPRRQAPGRLRGLRRVGNRTVTPRPARGNVAAGPGRIRLVGAALLVVLVLLTGLQAPWTEGLQSAWFDAEQVLMPSRCAHCRPRWSTSIKRACVLWVNGPGQAPNWRA